VIDGSSDRGDDRKNKQRRGAIAGKVREQDRDAEAGEHEKGSAKERTVARIEKAVDHRAVS
jgi:hypothetical protein